MDARRDDRRRGFSLVELLVAIAIILVLMALMGAAITAARSSGSKLKTESAVTAIGEILQRHYTNCESGRVGASTDRGLAIRRQVTADMPDSWAEVDHMKQNAQEFKSPRQRGYVAFYDAVKPTPQYGDAECLFMIVMQGGLADCLACSALDSVSKGDLDVDGAMEFWDSWGKPIHYVLWPGGFELPPGSGKFFSTTAPFTSGSVAPAPGGMMRPLVVSVGADKDEAATLFNKGSYLALGSACGDPLQAQIGQLGGLVPGARDAREDDLTNFDRDVRR